MSGKNVLAAGLTAALLAATPMQRCVAEVPAPLLACTAEADAAQRLACFDRAVAQMAKSAEVAGAGTPGDPPVAAAAAPAPAAAQATAPASTSAAVAVAPTPAAVASSSPSRSPEEDFGLRQEREQPTKLTELNATATTVSTRPHGELVVTLDNDQVWAEIAPSKIKLNPGDAVKIEAATLGSFILIAPNGRSSRVKRVR